MKRMAGLLFLVTLGCASAASAPPGPRQDRNKITAEQLTRVASENLYDAVRLLQPQWLQDRGPNSFSSGPATAVVYIDGSRAGGLDNLRNVPVNAVVEIKYLPAAEASARYGMDVPRGVIEVSTKKQ